MNERFVNVGLKSVGVGNGRRNHSVSKVMMIFVIEG